MFTVPLCYRYLIRYIFTEGCYKFLDRLPALVIIDIEMFNSLPYMPTKPLFKILVFIAYNQTYRTIILKSCISCLLQIFGSAFFRC